MSSTSRQTWVMWCCSSSVSTESFRSSVSCRCNKSREKKALPSIYPLYRYAVVATQLLWILGARVSCSKVTAIFFVALLIALCPFVIIDSDLCSSREYCKRLHLSDNNTQFLQNFLSLMLDISPESDECECVNCSLQYLWLLQTHKWRNCFCFVPQVTKALSTTWY